MKLKRSVAWKHGTRVRLGSRTGPRGVLLQFEKIDEHTGELTTFWKVALQGVLGRREFRPASEMIVDGVGTHVTDACLDCGLPFVTESLAPGGEDLCVRCAADAYGSQSGNFPRADEIDFSPRRRRRF